MLIKFETKSQRVKGLSFHPKRPWILASLHTGLIQLWDYRMGTLIDQFDEHEGPVRSVDFHKTQPLFVSGGDDYKIKVWNYKLRRCLFTLTGHLDYIRTVEFHVEQPWIVSSSDDQTIRIWNWQSRTCLATLTGHNHYVMCASFHPTDDLVVSASLDQTVRVWDISGLKKKAVIGDDFNVKISQLNQDLFGTNDVMVKYILEGHDRGVNWAAFHPTHQLIISAADDRQVKMWRINETRAWEVETLSGHLNNVSCARFHAKKDLVVSNSEDKTIRVWKLSNNQFITSYKRENDRFWILAVHPFQNLIAAGHDSGLMIFKLERERPAFVSIKDTLLYIKDKYLRRYNYTDHTDVPVALLRRTSSNAPHSLHFNPQENCILVTTGGAPENCGYELFKIPKSNSNDIEVATQVSKGKALAGVFIGINKYAVLTMDKSKIQVRNINNDTTKEIPLPIMPVDNIFQASSGRVLLKTEEKVHLYDFEQQSIVAEIPASSVRYIVWSDDNSRVALISKHIIIVANSKLEPLCSVHETIRIKSGAFDEQGVFIYTTLNHMKYCLPNGDSGTIKTLELPIYISKVKGKNVHIVDREGTVSQIVIDATEYRFKMALLSGKTHEIKSIIGQSKILGDSIIAYLQQKGYPQIAMRFVQDDMTKFDLALECGNIEAALQVAKKVDDKECWQRVGNEALRQGNFPIVEKAYQQTKDFEKLSFLYLITGNAVNLQKMLKIAGLRQDVMSRFHNALFLGDVEQRVRILQESGMNSLAYTTAAVHGLTELAEEIKKTLDPDHIPELPENATLLIPPTPILKETVWPLLHTDQAVFETEDQAKEEDVSIAASGWAGAGIQIPDDGAPAQVKSAETPAAERQEGGEEQLLLGGWESLGGSIEELNQVASAESEEIFIAPNPERSIIEHWPENSNHPADHIAAGSFQTAMQLLNQTCAVVNFAPLKDIFMSVYMSSRGQLPISSLLPPLSIALQRNLSKDTDDIKHNSLPLISSYTLAGLSERVKVASKNMTDGNFEEAQKVFRNVLHQLLFVVLSNKKDERDAKEILRICSEYVTATRLELVRRTVKDSNPKMSAELAAYLTRCKLNNSHIMLGLVSAMSVCFTINNYLTAADFAKRLLKMSPPAPLIKQANYVLQTSEQKPQNKYELNYDDRNPFVICAKSLTPIYAGSNSIKCGYCQSPYLPKFKGELCSICEVAEIGVVGNPGLSVYRAKANYGGSAFPAMDE